MNAPLPFRRAMPLALLLGAAALAGCCPGKHGKQATAATPGKSSTVGVAATHSEGVLFEATPSALRQCVLKQGTGDQVSIHWDANSKHPGKVRIWVQTPGQARKLWTESGAAGQQSTGPWVKDGTRFTLTTAQGSPLATLVMHAKPCH